MIPYVLNPLIPTQSFFLSSVFHITVFLPIFSSSSSQSLCEGSSDLEASGERRGDLTGRVFASRYPREHQKRNRVPHPDLSISQLLLGVPFSALSLSLPSHDCGVRLTFLPLETEFLHPKTKSFAFHCNSKSYQQLQLLVITLVKTITLIKTPVISLITFWMQLFTTMNVEGRCLGFFFYPLSSHPLALLPFTSHSLQCSNPMLLFFVPDLTNGTKFWQIWFPGQLLWGHQQALGVSRADQPPLSSSPHSSLPSLLCACCCAGL